MSSYDDDLVIVISMFKVTQEMLIFVLPQTQTMKSKNTTSTSFKSKTSFCFIFRVKGRNPEGFLKCALENLEKPPYNSMLTQTTILVLSSSVFYGQDYGDYNS